MARKNEKTIHLDENGDPVTVYDDETPWSDSEEESEEGARYPHTLVVVPLSENVLFPGMTIPLILESSSSQNAVEFAKTQGPYLALVPRLEPIPPDVPSPPSPAMSELAEYGVLAKALKLLNLPDGNRSVVVECISRIHIKRPLREKPFLIGEVSYPRENYKETTRNKALWRASKMSLQELFKEIPNLPEGFNLAAANLEGPAELTDFVAAHIDIKRERRLQLLFELNIEKRLEIIAESLTSELELARLAGRIRDEIRERVEKNQRDFYLREQIKAIRKELGEEVDQKELIARELEEKIENEGIPEEAANRARKELKRLEILSPESPEYNIIHTYLDWIISLPWNKETEDNTDIELSRRILDEDHYGLKEVKERIIEFLAVKKLNPSRKGTLLCLAGPPGVGKTSLGKSIARCLGREFYRFSLGGMRDEAEIKGHRRTYIGAMPGKILQGLKSVEVRNPLFMLDEIDKLGSNAVTGDPSSAMLEVLDPAQNFGFRDHYMDIPFDLSQVMFICTANVKANIPAPLRDRMEVIDIPGYIEDEKVAIANNYLIPRQKDANGLKKSWLKFGKGAISSLITGWTAEAGVRNLERTIEKICRKAAAQMASQDKIRPLTITKAKLPEFLGPRRNLKESLQSPQIGSAVGLAWTPVGGDILKIETTRMPGKGRTQITGHLGDVMRESVEIAISYIRHNQKKLHIPSEVFEKEDLHIHFPAGAVPKDGPSAGVTITSALISLLYDNNGLKPRGKLAMTGEMTLSGDVLPVGGIREKVLAARSAGVDTVIIPHKNQADAKEIPPETIKGLTFVYASKYPDVFETVFQSKMK